MDSGDIVLRPQEGHGRDHQGKTNGLHDPGGWPECALLQHDEGKYKGIWVVMQHSLLKGKLNKR